MVVSQAHRGGRAVGEAVAAFVLTPFAITGVFRVAGAVPTWLPFVVVLAAAAVLRVRRPGLRPVALGMASAAMVHAAFLAWLFTTTDLGGL